MSQPHQVDVHNRLLKALSHADFDLLRPNLTHVNTSTGQILIGSDAPVLMLYFPESGIVSVSKKGGRGIEMGLIGREGVVGAAPVFLGTAQTPFEHSVLLPGVAVAIGTGDLLSAVKASPTLHDLLLRCIHVLLVQSVHAAFVNASCSLEVRVARLLLMFQDRVGADEIVITHENLSTLLSVQRTSVTLAIQNLEGTGCIRARRGRIELRDRRCLLDAAGEGYGLPEAEYARLMTGAQVAEAR